MRRFLIRSLGALAVGALLCGVAHAGADFYLKLDGIEGEATAGGGDGLAVASWSFGTSNPTAAGPGSMSAGRMAAAPAEPAPGSSGTVSVTRVYDKASPVLAKRCADGTHFPSVVIKRCASGECRAYELENVAISSFSLSNDGSGKASETLTLRYHRWRWADAASSPAASALRESPTRQSDKATASAPAKAK